LHKRFFDVFSLVALIAFPAAIGLASVAAPAVLVLLGDKWAEAIPLVRILAVAGLVGALQSNLHLIVIAMGRPKAITIASAAVLSISLPILIVATLRYGIVGAAYAYAGCSLLGLCAIHIVFFRLSGVQVRPYVSLIWRPALASLLLAAAVAAADLAFLVNADNLARLLWLILVGATTYAATLWVLWRLSGSPSTGEQRIADLFHQATSRLLYGQSSPSR
jgi:O-antigen/teichoic acid export membrane protein